MFSRNKKDYSEILIYTLGTFINNGIGFLSLFLFTRIMHIEQYETYLRFGFLYSVAHAAFSLQANSIIPVFYAKNSNVLSSALWIQICGYFIGYIALLLIPHNWLEFNALLLIVHAAAYTMSMTLSTHYNQSGRAMTSIFWQLAHPILLLVSFCVYFTFDNTASGRIYSGTVVSSIITGVILILKLKRLKVDRELLLMIRYSLPLVGHVLLGIGVGGLYKLFGRDNPIAEISIYFSVILLFLAVSDVLYRYYQPRFYRSLDQNKPLFRRPILYMIVTSFMLGIIFWVSAPTVVSLIAPPDFRLANPGYMKLLFLVVTAQVCYRFLLGYLQYYRKSLSVLKITFCASLLFSLYIYYDASLYGYLIALALFYLGSSTGLILSLNKNYVSEL